VGIGEGAGWRDGDGLRLLFYPHLHGYVGRGLFLGIHCTNS